jgi:hypothetical protein
MLVNCQKPHKIVGNLLQDCWQSFTRLLANLCADYDPKIFESYLPTASPCCCYAEGCLECCILLLHGCDVKRTQQTVVGGKLHSTQQDRRWIRAG